VEIELADGRRLCENQARPRGGPDAPMTRSELEAKFSGNAALAMPSDQIERVLQGLRGLAAAPRVADVLTALTPLIPERTRS
jgi:2-methylcitrate dehydratase PrpD